MAFLTEDDCEETGCQYCIRRGNEKGKIPFPLMNASEAFINGKGISRSFQAPEISIRKNFARFTGAA
jgi:hypothetical protein